MFWIIYYYVLATYEIILTLIKNSELILFNTSITVFLVTFEAWTSSCGGQNGLFPPPFGEKWGKQGEKEGKDENVKKWECSGDAGSRFKCADARSRFKVLSTEGSVAAGSKFKV